MRWSRLVLILLLCFDVWYRGHTFGPTVRDAIGIDLWPASAGASEPLDCDEAAYAYIGHRILRGDVMYRDLTENKPPLGYWLYTLTVALGGYQELAIRVMPIPFVLATIALVWWIALRLGGPGSACCGRRDFRLLEHGSLSVRQWRQSRAFHQLFRGRVACSIDPWMGPRQPLVARRFGNVPGCGDAGQAGCYCPGDRLRRGRRLASLDAGSRMAGENQALPDRRRVTRHGPVVWSWRPRQRS